MLRRFRSVQELPLNVHDLQAPTGDGDIRVEPAFADIGPHLASNRHTFGETSPTLLGRPLNLLRGEARAAAIQAASAHHAEAGEPLPEVRGDGLLVAGHQPDLFHPGVWLKNFVLRALAARLGLTPLNLVIDIDTAKNVRVRLPSRDYLSGVPFDHWKEEVPFEERRVEDEPLFARFPEEVARVSRNWPFEPLLPDFWIEVLRQSRRTRFLGERLAAARRSIERQWGCHNFEVPMSGLCRTETFAWFACHLLEELPRFHALYNVTVEAYRQRYGLRSRNHPVPDLGREGDWLEMPLWSWRAEQPHRRRLLARRTSTGFELRSGTEQWPTLRHVADATESVSQWMRLEANGFKVRTRALTTTLFARLFLADLFVHGLGGGKYDEITDGLMRDFYGIEPPAFVVATGTLRLPFPPSRVTEDDRRWLVRKLRDLAWNPQRHLANADSAAKELMDARQRWVEYRCDNRADSRRRYYEIRRLNSGLVAYVKDQVASAHPELDEVSQQLRLQEINSRRDFAFCLYPAEKLQGFLQGIV